MFLSVQASITEYHRMVALQTTEIYSSQLWRPEAQEQGTSRFMSDEDPLPLLFVSSHGEG